ncbi:MAG: 30S ribosomal protein S13 [Opitutales bacterium]|nr:30S ribosomal protein S13 [Opitutales bacterium]
MPRILGVDIPNNKRIEYALRYIYGVGPTRAAYLVKEAEIDPATRSHELTEDQLNKLTSLINDNKYVVEGDLRREVLGNIKRHQAIKSYRGMRHIRGLPCRGQRTGTNARTRKGGRKTVGVVRKK